MSIRRLLLALGLIAGLGFAGPAGAVPIAIGIGGFSGGETVETYGLVQTFAPVDGVTFSGVLHNFSIGGISSNDAVIDGGPGNSNNITVANIEGDAAGILELVFSSDMTRVGYGYALSTTVPFAKATSVELFDSSNVSLGSLSFDAFPDPTFIGGFAGVESATPFARAEISFATTGRFAFDNLRFESTNPIPEPSGLPLFSVGIAALGLVTRRRRE